MVSTDIFLRKGKPDSQSQVEKLYHLQTTSKPRGRRHWLVPQLGSALLPSTGCPGTMQLSPPCYWEPTLVWHQPSWEERAPPHQHDVRLCSGMAITTSKKEMQPTISKYGLPNSMPSCTRNLKTSVSQNKRPFVRGPEQGRCQPPSLSLQPWGR